MTANAGKSEILTRLKQETRVEHEAIESTLDVVAERMTRERYRRILERFYGFYRPVEAALLSISGWKEHGVDLEQRIKSGNVEADLRSLGDPFPEKLPQCNDLPSLTSAAEGFGCLYVIEGSTLGGQVIIRHVRSLFGLTPESGGRFFNGYGDQTGPMWREFGSALSAFADTKEKEDVIVSTAIVTFIKLRLWCTEGVAQ